MTLSDLIFRTLCFKIKFFIINATQKVVFWTLVQHVRKVAHSLFFPESGEIRYFLEIEAKYAKNFFVVEDFEPQTIDYKLAPLLTQPWRLGRIRHEINESYSAVSFRPFKDDSWGYY